MCRPDGLIFLLERTGSLLIAFLGTVALVNFVEEGEAAMAESISRILLQLGAIFMLPASIGPVRMPDVLMRLHSCTYSMTLGVGLILLAIALFFNDFTIAVRAFAIVIFLFSSVPLWEGTLGDEMRGRDDPHTQILPGMPGLPIDQPAWMKMRALNLRSNPFDSKIRTLSLSNEKIGGGIEMNTI